jgi:hypothetical protein
MALRLAGFFIALALLILQIHPMPEPTRIKAEHPLTDAQERLGFSEVPVEYHMNSFGIPYIRNPDSEGGFLYVTRWGWHHMAHLRQENWYTGKKFVKEGQRLRGSTGTVYKFPSRPDDVVPMDLLLKVSRIAEEIPGKLAGEFPELTIKTSASFNSPFEEVGMIQELRNSNFGPSELHIRTKRPLAIYCAPRDLPAWQLGRNKSDLRSHVRKMERDQSSEPDGMKVKLMENRQYFSIYAWVPGLDAQAAMEKGLMTEQELGQLSRRVNAELDSKGFRILDNNPKHFIVRQGSDGELLRYRGDLLYVQVDFELLQRNEAYESYLNQLTSLTMSTL